MIVQSKKSVLKILRFEGDWSALERFVCDANCNEGGKFYKLKDEPKKDDRNKTRKVEAPSHSLKRLQRNLHYYLRSRTTFPSYVQGSVRGCTPVSNAEIHRGSKFFFQTDIRKFFPSVHQRLVYEALKHYFAPEIAEVLTHLATLMDHLPTGAPTSPIIANIVLMKVDNLNERDCEKHDIRQSRWMDDITLSSSKDFSHADVIDDILDRINTSGFRIHRGKTQYLVGSAEITGSKVRNGRLTATKKIRKKLSKAKSDPNGCERVQGIKAYLRTQGRSNEEHFRKRRESRAQTR